jgi:hypothetical protein
LRLATILRSQRPSLFCIYSRHGEYVCECVPKSSGFSVPALPFGSTVKLIASSTFSQLGMRSFACRTCSTRARTQCRVRVGTRRRVGRLAHVPTTPNPKPLTLHPSDPPVLCEHWACTRMPCGRGLGDGSFGRCPYSPSHQRSRRGERRQLGRARCRAEGLGLRLQHNNSACMHMQTN